MNALTPALLPILPTRVRRNYRGGLSLDRLEGVAAPADGDRPESWIASTLTATNPDLPPLANEGLTRTQMGGEIRLMRDLLASASEFYLGAAHVRKHGANFGFLAKLLDSSMRLHVQVHPTSAFAQQKLGAPYGKLEIYYVLDVRPGCEGYVRLGFQKAPSRTEWRRIVEQQDIPGMDACFEKIPVKPGDVWVVPGGMPHAIGEGVLMIEVMEPSDLVVRCEFEREGVVLPPNSRYMGKDLDFCLDVFDYTAYSEAAVRAKCQLAPTVLAEGLGWVYDQLVSAKHTSCFEVYRVRAETAVTLPADDRATLLIQTRGVGRVLAGQEVATTKAGYPVLAAAAAGGHLRLEPSEGAGEWILCRPARQS